MYKYEQKMKDAESSGIVFSEGQKIYLRCASLNGIELLDHLYDKYSTDYMSHSDDDNALDYLSMIGLLISIMDFFDSNMCALVDQMIEKNKAYK